MTTVDSITCDNIAADTIDETNLQQPPGQEESLDEHHQIGENDAEIEMHVCEEMLDNKMAALELRDEITTAKVTTNGDGSDSGVEFGTNNGANMTVGVGVLQRALSSNSGGYASSTGTGGYEDANGTISCDSSMISFCSDMCDSKTVNTMLLGARGHDCTSEGGSESSSVTGGPICAINKRSTVKKKVAVTEPLHLKSSPKKTNESSPSTLRPKTRTLSANRSNTVTNGSKVSSAGGPNLATRERARSREKVSPLPPSTLQRTNSLKRPHKPDSFPVGIKDNLTSPITQKSSLARTPSLSRGRTPGTTPTDDGRWPWVGGKNGTATARTSRGGSAAPEAVTIKTRVGAIALDNKSTTFDKYATLPRRRKEKSADDLKGRDSRSNSITRDITNNNRMTSSTVATKKSTIKDSPSKTLPPYPRTRKTPPKTKIYHETSVQTALTSEDVANAFAGAAKPVKIDAIEMVSKGTQSDIRDKEVERLEAAIRKINDDQNYLQNMVKEKSQALNTVEQQLVQEREEKLAIQKELQCNSERVLAILESVHVNPPDTNESADSLLILESKLNTDTHLAEQQREEINKLRKNCCSLQRDLEQSLERERNLIRERECNERETHELQEFLQNEKMSLVDALKETEAENQSWKEKCIQKDIDIDRLQDECRHLVRVSEQRRQENMGMRAKYGALESRSKDLIVQQSTAVSGASVALASLGSRLDNLVEQLIASYNISEQELEDVVYHNEAYTQSGSSGEGSPEYEVVTKIKTDNGGPLSPQRSHSFINVVINAIKNAASITKPSTIKKELSTITGEDSDSTEMLDSETEPCLMMENVLEDVTMPDSHSHNLVSTTGLMLSQIEIPSEMVKQDESFNNLSQAIANRQQIELQTSIMANRSSAHNSLILRQHSAEQSTSEDISAHESIAEMPSISEYCTAQSLVDQVIDVDNLVTKLLKVLRIIQLDNDNCIQHLICEKNKLQLNKEEIMEKLKEWEELNSKLKCELKDASEQLTLKSNDLAVSKSELHRHRIEIDRLNEDICNLSTLCSQNKTRANVISITENDILAALNNWKDNGTLPEPELITHILAACNEMPLLKEKLLAKERQICDMSNSKSKLSPLKEAIKETKRQYEAIDRALETLHTIQSIVQQNPSLTQLQHDLEETNFQSAATIPLFTALLSAAGATTNGTGNGTTNLASSSPDCNANAAATNGSNGGTNGNLQINGDSSGNQTIDSTA